MPPRSSDTEVVMGTWQVIDDERLALASDPALLGHSRWDIQSACSDWKIRHVVGHLIAGADVKARSIPRRRPPISHDPRLSSSWGPSVMTIVDDAGSFSADGIDRRRQPDKAHADDQRRTLREFILP